MTRPVGSFFHDTIVKYSSYSKGVELLFATNYPLKELVVSREPVEMLHQSSLSKDDWVIVAINNKLFLFCSSNDDMIVAIILLAEMIK